MSVEQPFLERDFYSDPRRRARSGLVRAISRPLRRAGFDLEVRTFYSPIPDLSTISESQWRRRSELAGIDFDLERQFESIERDLAPHIAEFAPPRSSGDRYEYHLDNGLYGPGDADLLYAFIRHAKPSRVLELGAGFSTLVSAAAVRANREGGHDTSLISCDPYADAAAVSRVDGVERLLPVAAEALGPELFGELGAGDILFIDSSH